MLYSFNISFELIYISNYLYEEISHWLEKNFENLKTQFGRLCLRIFEFNTKRCFYINLYFEEKTVFHNVGWGKGDHLFAGKYIKHIIYYIREKYIRKKFLCEISQHY